MSEEMDVHDVIETLLAASRWINYGERLCKDLKVPYGPLESYDTCRKKIAEAQTAAETILQHRSASAPNFGRF